MKEYVCVARLYTRGGSKVVKLKLKDVETGELQVLSYDDVLRDLINNKFSILNLKLSNKHNGYNMIKTDWNNNPIIETFNVNEFDGIGLPDVETNIFYCVARLMENAKPVKFKIVNLNTLKYIVVTREQLIKAYENNKIHVENLSISSESIKLIGNIKAIDTESMDDFNGSEFFNLMFSYDVYDDYKRLLEKKYILNDVELKYNEIVEELCLKLWLSKPRSCVKFDGGNTLKFSDSQPNGLANPCKVAVEYNRDIDELSIMLIENDKYVLKYVKCSLKDNDKIEDYIARFINEYNEVFPLSGKQKITEQDVFNNVVEAAENSAELGTCTFEDCMKQLMIDVNNKDNYNNTIYKYVFNRAVNAAVNIGCTENGKRYINDTLYKKYKVNERNRKLLTINDFFIGVVVLGVNYSIAEMFNTKTITKIEALYRVGFMDDVLSHA
ncbi:MAG: hypothetical protein IJ593_05920 [Lachnospiraceae bacterium]|nr:hypothetical protein [Lachnospiraceae bacterium]